MDTEDPDEIFWKDKGAFPIWVNNLKRSPVQPLGVRKNKVWWRNWGIRWRQRNFWGDRSRLLFPRALPQGVSQTCDLKDTEPLVFFPPQWRLEGFVGLWERGWKVGTAKGRRRGLSYLCLNWRKFCLKPWRNEQNIAGFWKVPSLFCLFFFF